MLGAALVLRTRRCGSPLDPRDLPTTVGIRLPTGNLYCCNLPIIASGRQPPFPASTRQQARNATRQASALHTCISRPHTVVTTRHVTHGAALCRDVECCSFCRFAAGAGCYAEKKQAALLNSGSEKMNHIHAAVCVSACMCDDSGVDMLTLPH